MNEGIARCLTQACLYGLESKKTCIQLYGNNIKLNTMQNNLKSLTSGAVTSSISAGVVYFTYFTVYNNLKNNFFAGAISAFTTSIIKIPISNSMRILQSSPHKTNIIKCFMKIKNKSGITGLYSGYGVSLFEDIIEIDLRERLYNHFNKYNKKNVIHRKCLQGALVGIITSSLCMPLDSIRAHMAHTSIISSNPFDRNPFLIMQKKGVLSLYNGVQLRASINALKFALYYTFYELISKAKIN